MDSASLQIVITAIDSASESLSAITDQLKELGSVSDDVNAQMSAGTDATAASLDRLTVTVGETGASMGALATKVDASTEATLSNTAAQEKQTAALTESGAAADKNNTSFSKMGLGTVAAAAGVGYAIDKTVSSYSNLQTSMVKLVTSAGESAGNLNMVTTGVQNVAKATGTSTTDLGNAMYYIESAGFHGAAGLNVLTAAAKGAKDEQASALSVADATTTILNDYGKNTYTATQAVNGMISAVSRGKTTLQLFSTSLSNVLPTAHALGISFAQTAGAIATMTAQGMTAKRATQDLNHAISSLANPTTVQTNMMLQMGLNSQTVAKQLGDPSVGLTGTIKELSNAILQHMGPAGLVLQSALMNPMEAAADAKQAIAALPGPVQSLAEQLEAGSISWTAYRTAIRALPPTMENLGSNFETTFLKTASLNTQIKAGVPSAMTYNAVMAKMTGGQNGLQAALLLSTNNGRTFNDNVNAISKSMDSATTKIIGWSNVQGTFNQQMSELREDLVVFGQQMGKVLIPVLTTMAKGLAMIFAPLADLVTKFPALSAIILVTVGSFLTLISVAILTSKAFKTIGSGMQILKDSFTLTTKLVEQLAIKMGLLDSASLTTTTSLARVGESVGAIAPEAEGATAAIGEEGGAGLLGSLSLLGPVGIAAGVATIGATALIATHWSAVKKGVDDAYHSVMNFLGVKSTDNVTVNAQTTGQSKAVVGSDSKSILADQQKEQALLKQEPVLEAAVTRTKINLTNAQNVYNSALASYYAANAKYGVGSSQAKAADTELAKAKQMLTQDQGLSTTATNKANAAFKQLSSTQQAQVQSLAGIKKALDQIPSATNRVKSAQDALSKSNADVKEKYAEYTQAVKMNDMAHGHNAISEAAVKYAQQQLNASIADAKSKSTDYQKALQNQGVALQTASYWTKDNDANIKALGSSHVLTQAQVKQMSDQLNAQVKALQPAKKAVDDHKTSIDNLGKSHSEVKAPIDNLNKSIDDSGNKLITAKNKADDETTSLGKMGNAAMTTKSQFDQLNSSMNNVNNTSNTGTLAAMKKLPGFASGVSNFQGGLAVVGESGPELVTLPPGSSVIPTGQTQQIMANSQAVTSSGSGSGVGGASGAPITLNVTFSGPVLGNSSQAQQFATQMWQSLQQIARQYGLQSNLPQIGIRPV